VVREGIVDGWVVDVVGGAGGRYEGDYRNQRDCSREDSFRSRLFSPFFFDFSFHAAVPLIAPENWALSGVWEIPSAEKWAEISEARKVLRI